MSGFKIESNIPFPATRKKTGLADTLRALKVGDSFVIGGDKQRSVRSAAYENRLKISVRDQRDGTIRVWRTA